MSEKAKSIIDIMKEQISKNGKKKGGSFWVKKDGSTRVRFLSDLDAAICIKFHGQWKVINPHPCLEYYGKTCDHCNDDNIKTDDYYVLTVWNYETKKREPFIYKMNNCTPYPALVSFFSNYGTIIDRDYKIEKHGEGTETAYTVVPLDKKKFIGDEEPFSKKVIFKKVLEAFPYNNGKLEAAEEVDEDEEDDEEEVKPTKKSKKKSTADDDEDDDDDESPKHKKAVVKQKQKDEEDEDDDFEEPKKKPSKSKANKKLEYDIDDDDYDRPPEKISKKKKHVEEDEEDENDEMEDDSEDDEPDYKAMSGDELKKECKKIGFDYKGRSRKEVIQMLEDGVPF